MSVRFPARRGFGMAKNRDKQRANKKKQQELDRKNEYGYTDLTPYNAIRVMNGKEIVFR